MKIVMINGQNHKGSTYHTGRILADKLQGDITEFFLPKDFGQFCTGCTSCFMKGEQYCPHFDALSPIIQAMDAADVLILTSPVYVYHVTGSMKAFLDHFGYRWMVHRPEERMFSKQAVCIATAAGGGMKSTVRDMADSLYFWGVPKTYKIGLGVRTTSYTEVPDKIKHKIDSKTTRIAEQILKKQGRVRPGIKTAAFFYLMRFVQRKGWNEADRAYWESKGWTGAKRPWR